MNDAAVSYELKILSRQLERLEPQQTRMASALERLVTTFERFVDAQIGPVPIDQQAWSGIEGIRHIQRLSRDFDEAVRQRDEAFQQRDEALRQRDEALFLVRLGFDLLEQE